MNNDVSLADAYGFVALTAAIVALIIAVGFLFGASNVNERWTAWQECVQTRAGGDASLQWCDDAFRNPIGLQE